MANKNWQGWNNRRTPSRLEVLQTQRDTLADTISRLERELRQAEYDLANANRVAEADRVSEFQRLHEQQTLYEWATFGANFAHQHQVKRRIRRKNFRPFLRMGMVLVILAALLLFTKSSIVLGLGLVGAYFFWRVFFGRRSRQLRQLGTRDLARALERETPAARELWREAEFAAGEARRLNRSDPTSPESRKLSWQVQALKTSLRAHQERLRELDAQIKLFRSYP